MEGNIRIPRHVAIIMDGNGRWAKKRLLPRSAGHSAGMKRMVTLSEEIFDRGVEWCTLYALSTENLQRPQEELNALFELFRQYFRRNTATLKQKSIRLKIIGDLTLLPKDVEEIIRAGEAETAEGTRGVLVLAIGYGGRQDILNAANRAVREGKPVTEEEFSSYLSTEGIPDPDLLIRTGKEVRISNFLLWQSAYTELYFTDTLFPDFSKKQLDRAFESYANRERRYGKVKE